MLSSHLKDAAISAAKAYAHDNVEPRHVGYAIAVHLKERADVEPLYERARSALNPRGMSMAVPTLTDEASALLDSINSQDDAVAALLTLLGEEPPEALGGAQQAVEEENPSQVAVEETAQPQPEETIEDVLAELDALIGLNTVKEQVRGVIAVVQANQERARAGLPTVNPGLHLVFTGPPGTGKTTVARLIARLYAASGALPDSRFTEVDRSDLVAGYVGQTAIKTVDVIKKTLPGVLFVDEAYALTPSHTSDFGAEAIATIVKAMEDHRDRLAVIVAGYGEEMTGFVESNPGLRSRFKTFIDFPGYAPDELSQIFAGMVEAVGLTLANGAIERAENLFKDVIHRSDFGNARFARSLFEQAYSRMAIRAADDGKVHVDELREILPEDLEWDGGNLDVERRRIGFDAPPRD